MCRQWRQEHKQELSTDEWKKILLDLKKNRIKNIHFTGGEPLLRDDLAALIRYCKENGFTTGLTTNGMLMNEELLNALIRSGLRSVAISVDALSDRYEKIRGLENTFGRLKSAAIAIARARKIKGIDAYINFTLMNENIEDFYQVKRFADDIGLPVGLCLLDKNSSIFDLDDNKNRFWIREEKDIKRLDVLLDFLKGELRKNPRSLILNFPSLEYIKNYFSDPRQSHIPCVISQDRIFIDPYGDIFGGCLSMGVLGNIKEVSLGVISKEKKYKDAKKNMFYKRCPGCSCGYIFNIRHMPGRILKDIATRIHSVMAG